MRLVTTCSISTAGARLPGQAAGLAGTFEGAELRAGTLSYMAPEQIEGTGISVRSDVYSLGLVLYELFTGKRVFDGGTLSEVTQKQLRTPPTNPSSFMTGFDPVTLFTGPTHRFTFYAKDIINKKHMRGFTLAIKQREI